MGTVIKNRGTSCVGVRKTGTTLIRVSTVMGTLYFQLFGLIVAQEAQKQVGDWVESGKVTMLILF